MKHIKTTIEDFLNEQNVNTIAQLYKKYSKTYPYAVDAIAYYIFGDRSDDNILVKAYKGVYGRDKEVDSSKISKYILDNEYSWEEYIDDIDDFVKNLPTKDGGILSDYF